MWLWFALGSAVFAALAEAAQGSHIHYDEFNSFEEGSAEIIN